MFPFLIIVIIIFYFKLFLFPQITGISHPCQTNPCLNGGTCQGNTKDWNYNCICTEGFWGDNCENGECLTLCSVFGKHAPNTAASPLSSPLGVFRGKDDCDSPPYPPPPPPKKNYTYDIGLSEIWSTSANWSM